MAKTCFYCGKELAPGERCGCRGTSSRVASNTNGATTGKPADSAYGSASAKNYSSNSSASSSSSDSSASSSQKKDAAASKADAKAAKAAAREQKKREKQAQKNKQVWGRAGTSTPDSPYGTGSGASTGGRPTFSGFITRVRALFPSFSKVMRPVMSYIWHPVTTIQNRSQVVPIGKMVAINTLFATLTSLMVLFTNRTNSPFVGMLISLMFGKTDLFSAHPITAFFTISAILWFSVMLLACCFMLTSRIVNRKLSLLRALDTVTMSSIYMCFADVLIFFSVLLGTQGSFTLIFVALIVMGIAHFVSLKQDLTLTDNSAFNMLAISYLMFYALAQLGIGIIIRVATWL
ncbi:MAG: hypothetical protein J5752_08565 [Clostridiales bacterium]|nr:hypothetical protein [Clostridiales bacterium]